MTHVTCRLTAKNRDQLWNPMLDVIEYGLPYLFYVVVTNRQTDRETTLRHDVCSNGPYPALLTLLAMRAESNRNSACKASRQTVLSRTQAVSVVYQPTVDDSQLRRRQKPTTAVSDQSAYTQQRQTQHQA